MPRSDEWERPVSAPTQPQILSRSQFGAFESTGLLKGLTLGAFLAMTREGSLWMTTTTMTMIVPVRAHADGALC